MGKVHVCCGRGVDDGGDVEEGDGRGVAVGTDSSFPPQANPDTNIIPISTIAAILAIFIACLKTGVMRILQGDSPVNSHASMKPG
jgi:hypothetical protein